MEKTAFKLKTSVEKVCPSCKRHYSLVDDLKICPEDESLLCPIIDHDLVGQTIGELTITAKIGEGSGASVYLAHSKSGFSSAIKVLRNQALNDPQAVKRFQKEAQVIAMLSHTNIAQVHDFGLSDDGQPYLVMEYVEGKTLAEYLDDKGQFEVDEALRAFLEIIDALELAHSHSVTHRDVKPSNIMLSDSGHVTVLDFGLAKLTGQTDAMATITQTGASVGSPAYMSPEQCLGENLDARSDVYSLGCLMYECLTGRTVFSSENAFDCMNKHTTAIPTHISQLRKDIPDHIARAVMTCLNKDAKQRFSTMTELRNALLGTARGAGHSRRKYKTAAKLIAILSLIFFVVTCLRLGSPAPPVTKVAMLEPAITVPAVQEMPPGEPKEASTPVISLARGVNPALDKLTFQAVVPLEASRHSGTQLAGRFTMDGAVPNSLVEISCPAISALKTNGSWYVIDDISIYSFNPKSGKTKELGKNLESHPFLTGIAEYEGKIKILNSDGIDSFFLTFDPKKQKFSKRGKSFFHKDEWPRPQFKGLAPIPGSNEFYTIGYPNDERPTIPCLYKISTTGSVTKCGELSQEFGDSSSCHHVELTLNGKYLIATVQNDSIIFDVSTANYAIDLKTMKIYARPQQMERLANRR